MTTESILRICGRYAALAKASPEKGPDILVDLVKALAADRAGTVFLALETEAELCIGKEKVEDLRERLLTTKALAGCEFATSIGDYLEFEAKAEEAKREFELLAARSYAAAFDELVRSAKRGGTC